MKKVLFLINDYLTLPLGVGYLAAVLVRDGHRVEMVSLRDRPRQRRMVEDFRPDIIALSLVTGRHGYFLECAAAMRTAVPAARIVAGGPHPTFYPACIQDERLDGICCGEGEAALSELVQAFEPGGSLPCDSANWSIKFEGDGIQHNDVRPLIDDLDSLPFPDHASFDRACPRAPRHTVYCMTGSGCPYDCSYCFNHAYRELYRGKGRMCRRRSVGNIISELNTLRARYSLHMVVFQDDTFILDRDWLREFAVEYLRAAGLPFPCHLRADLVDEEVVELLASSGCRSVKMGLESASDRVRNAIFNRNMELDQYMRAGALLKKKRIALCSQNILGAPGSTFDDDLYSFAVNRRLAPAFSFATLLQVYPHTRIAEYACSRGYSVASADEFPGDFYSDSNLNIPHKKERGRLRALFAVAVALRLPTGCVRLLVALPLLRPLFEVADKLWKGYCLRFRIFPYRQSPGAFLREVREYLTGSYF